MKKLFPFIVVLTVLSAILFYSFMPPQPIMWGHTGSPGEGNCTDCHGSYILNSHNGNVLISTQPLLTNNHYIPGQTYTISVTVTQNGDSLYAFDFEAVDSLGNDAGTLIVTDSIHTKTIIYSVNGRKNMFFNSLGNNYNYYTFKFNWTAPVNGRVSFYADGLVSNINGMTTGDYVYSDSIVNITPSSQSGILNFLLDKELIVYPNPTRDYFIIKNTSNTFLYSDTVDLIDGTGKHIFVSRSKTNVSNGNEVKYFLPQNMSNGIYYLKINSNYKKIEIVK